MWTINSIIYVFGIVQGMLSHPGMLGMLVVSGHWNPGWSVGLVHGCLSKCQYINITNAWIGPGTIHDMIIFSTTTYLRWKFICWFWVFGLWETATWASIQETPPMNFSQQKSQALWFWSSYPPVKLDMAMKNNHVFNRVIHLEILNITIFNSYVTLWRCIFY